MTSERFRPMLSAKLPCDKGKTVPTQDQIIADLQRMDWSRGFYASPKLDGIRAIKSPTEGLLSRSLTPIPNRFIQEALSSKLFDNLDGELIKGGVTEQINFNDTQSAVMSRDGSPEFTYAVFDDVTNPNYRFDKRTSDARDRITELLEFGNFQGLFRIEWVIQTHVKSIEELLAYEEDIVEQEYEGIIFRDPGCRYKNNRSTFREQGLLKLKRFIDAEAEIIGFEELYRNTNEPTISALGYTKRSHKLEGQMPAGTLGKLLCRGINGRFRDTEFSIGSGFSAQLRQEIWDNQPKYLGKTVKYKYQDAGAKNKPRAPIYLGFRSSEDLS